MNIVAQDTFNGDFDVPNIMKSDVPYIRLVWDPTGRTVSVFNISGISPLRILLIRKQIGNCEMFFLRLRGILQFPSSIMVCISELSATSLQQKCNLANDSEALQINEGNIYGMQHDCGPWYLTVFVPDTNTTELSVEVSEPYDPLVFRWLRVITNLCFIPGIILALKRRFYAEAIIYILTFTMSVVRIVVTG